MQHAPVECVTMAHGFHTHTQEQDGDAGQWFKLDGRKYITIHVLEDRLIKVNGAELIVLA